MSFKNRKRKKDSYSDAIGLIDGFTRQTWRRQRRSSFHSVTHFELFTSFSCVERATFCNQLQCGNLGGKYQKSASMLPGMQGPSIQ